MAWWRGLILLMISTMSKRKISEVVDKSLIVTVNVGEEEEELSRLVLSAEQIEEAIIRNLKHPPVEALNRGGDVDVELVDSCSTLPHKAKLVKKKRLDSGSGSGGVYYVLHIVDKIEMKPGQVMKLQYHGGAIFFYLV